MTATIVDLPSLRNIHNPTFRRIMRRAMSENRQALKMNLPENTVGKVISFRRPVEFPRVGKEDPVDAQAT